MDMADSLGCSSRNALGMSSDSLGLTARRLGGSRKSARKKDEGRDAACACAAKIEEFGTSAFVGKHHMCVTQTQAQTQT